MLSISLVGCRFQYRGIETHSGPHVGHLRCGVSVGTRNKPGGALSHYTLERTQIIAKPRKALAKETLQLTVEDGAVVGHELASRVNGVPAVPLPLIVTLAELTVPRAGGRLLTVICSSG